MKTVELIKDDKTGDLILPLDDEIFAELGWTVGDVVKWVDNRDGTWTISKQTRNEDD